MPKSDSKVLSITGNCIDTLCMYHCKYSQNCHETSKFGGFFKVTDFGNMKISASTTKLNIFLYLTVLEVILETNDIRGVGKCEMQKL